jgi:hypothetical protein
MTKQTKSTVPEKSVQSFLLLTPAIFHAAESARAVHPDAYTVWRDVFFKRGGFPLLG